jgi:hypothetical protein
MRSLRAGTIILIATTCLTMGCFPVSGAPTGPGTAPGGGGGGSSGGLAFLVGPNPAAAGSPISPEVKVIAVDAQGNVLNGFTGTVSVTLGSGGGTSGGSLSGTTSVAASGGLAIFPTLVINQPGTGYTLVVSAAGLGSVTSGPFTVF